MSMRVELQKFDTVKWMGSSYMITHLYTNRCRAKHVESGKSAWLRYEWIEQEASIIYPDTTRGYSWG